MKGKTPKINKLKVGLTFVIDEEGSSEDILNIESQIQELVDKDLAKAFQHRKNVSED